MLHYIVKCGEELRPQRIFCIENVKPCEPSTNMYLTHYIWSNFEYYYANSAVILIPTRASKIELYKASP